MEVSSSSPPAVPPRTTSQGTPPLLFQSRRFTQSRTPSPHCSTPGRVPSPRRSTPRVTPPPGNFENASSPRRLSTNNTVPLSQSSALNTPSSQGQPPPVPVRWDMCIYHTGQKYTAICTTCVKFLCNKCLLSEIYYHNQCSVAYLSDSAQQTCHALKESISERMETMKKTLTNFQTSLCKKRDRMLKKKNETVSEIKHYYRILRELILSKLQRDEEELINVMKGKVDEQDGVLLEKIQQCCATTGKLQDKHAKFQDIEQLSNSRNNRNSIEYLKELVNASDYLKDCEHVEKDIKAVRDAFLVIRFSVNSETEQTILNGNVACVEVLNSQSENRDRATFDSERINEVLCHHTIANESVPTSREERIESINENNELRVALPPVNEQILENDGEFSNSQYGANESIERENNRSTTVQISELINEFDTRLVNRANSSDERTGANALTNEMILSTIQTDTGPNTERGNDTVIRIDRETTPNIAVECTENAQSQITEQNARIDNHETADAHTETTETNTRQSVAVTVSNEQNAENATVHFRDDEPPPPYPGLTSTPEPPGPDEPPPPYPGTGTPPPYSLMPETIQQPGRSRLNGESGRDLSRMSVNLIDSDLQSMQLEIPSPTQTNTPRLSRPKVSKVFSVNEANDRRISGIIAIASFRDNAFLVVDRWNKKLKYFSSNGASFGGLIFREEPWDITDMTEDLVAVTVPKLNTLYKIKVTNSSIITTSTVSTLRSYACLAFNKVTQLFVCGQCPQFGEPVIDIIGINGGQIIQSFRTGFTPELRFSYPRYVKVNEEGMAIVCDWNLKCLVVFKLDGTVVGRYRGTVEFPLNEPTGIAYNPSAKEIYVIDAKHTSTLGAIHIVNLNCRCKEIVRWDNEFRVARAIVPHANGYVLGNKSGVLSIFVSRRR